jgi:hypothetical protein
MAPLSVPLATEFVLLPTPIAKLPGSLVHVEPPELPALMPLMDAQVALAAPAPLSAAAAKPDATALSSTPQASLLFEIALCGPIRVPPFARLMMRTTPYLHALHSEADSANINVSGNFPRRRRWL